MKIILNKLLHDIICVMSDWRDAAAVTIIVTLFVLGFLYLSLS